MSQTGSNLIIVELDTNFDIGNITISEKDRNTLLNAKKRFLSGERIVIKAKIRGSYSYGVVVSQNESFTSLCFTMNYGNWWCIATLQNASYVVNVRNI